MDLLEDGGTNLNVNSVEHHIGNHWLILHVYGISLRRLVAQVLVKSKLHKGSIIFYEAFLKNLNLMYNLCS